MLPDVNVVDSCTSGPTLYSHVQRRVPIRYRNGIDVGLSCVCRSSTCRLRRRRRSVSLLCRSFPSRVWCLTSKAVVALGGVLAVTILFTSVGARYLRYLLAGQDFSPGSIQWICYVGEVEFSGSDHRRLPSFAQHPVVWAGRLQYMQAFTGIL